MVARLFLLILVFFSQRLGLATHVHICVHLLRSFFLPEMYNQCENPPQPGREGGQALGLRFWSPLALEKLKDCRIELYPCLLFQITKVEERPTWTLEPLSCA